jgi:hypothetical protein
MKKKTGRKKELDSYIASVKASQKNVIWPDVLRGSRSVDEPFRRRATLEGGARCSFGAADRSGDLGACIFDDGGGVHLHGCRTRELGHGCVCGNTLWSRGMVHPKRSQEVDLNNH